MCRPHSSPFIFSLLPSLYSLSRETEQSRAHAAAYITPTPSGPLPHVFAVNPAIPSPTPMPRPRSAMPLTPCHRRLAPAHHCCTCAAPRLARAEPRPATAPSVYLLPTQPVSSPSPSHSPFF